MITYVLGAPGSGKSAAARILASLLPDHVVLDWDVFMAPADALTGRDITAHRDTWPAYRQLVRTVLEAMAHQPVVLLGVCTPGELAGWPIDAWGTAGLHRRGTAAKAGAAGRAGSARRGHP